MRWLPFGLLILLLLAAGWILRGSGFVSGLEIRGQGPADEEGEQPEHATLEARDSVPSGNGQEALLSDHSSQVRKRIQSEVAPVQGEAVPEVEAPVAVHGRVLNSMGYPVEGVGVRLVSHQVVDDPRSRSFFLSSSRALMRAGGAEAAGYTDRRGRFTLEAVAVVSELLIECGGSILSKPLVVPVSPDQIEQTIVLPSPSAGAGQIHATLLDLEGNPLPIERVESHLVKPRPAASGTTSQAAWIQHDPGLLFRGNNQWTLSGLAPGTWRIWVYARGGGIASEHVQLELDGEVQVVLRLASRSGQHGLGTSVWLDPSDLLTPDETNGLAAREIKGQRPRVLGEHAFDAYLQHTINFPGGELSAAYLLLDLEAEAGGADNDSISLEYIQGAGKGRWGWSSVIARLPGASSPWRNGARGHIELDLGRLPLADGSYRSLLDSLADGKLDLWIQDDTFVRSLRLTVVHRAR